MSRFSQGDLGVVFATKIGLVVLGASLVIFLRWREVQLRPFEAVVIQSARRDVLASLGPPQESFSSSAALRAAAEDWNLLCSEREDEISRSVGQWDRSERFVTPEDDVLRSLPGVEDVVDFYWAAPFIGYLLYYDSDQVLSRALRCSP